MVIPRDPESRDPNDDDRLSAPRGLGGGGGGCGITPMGGPCCCGSATPTPRGLGGGGGCGGGCGITPRGGGDCGSATSGPRSGLSV